MTVLEAQAVPVQAGRYADAVVLSGGGALGAVPGEDLAVPGRRVVRLRVDVGQHELRDLSRTSWLMQAGYAAGRAAVRAVEAEPAAATP